MKKHNRARRGGRLRRCAALRRAKRAASKMASRKRWRSAPVKIPKRACASVGGLARLDPALERELLVADYGVARADRRPRRGGAPSPREGPFSGDCAGVSFSIKSGR
jgi:hypothetical protein